MTSRIRVTIFCQRREISEHLVAVLSPIPDFEMVGIFTNERHLRRQIKTADIILMDVTAFANFQETIKNIRLTEIRPEFVALTNKLEECNTALVDGAIGCIKVSQPNPDSDDDCIAAIYQAHYRLVDFSPAQSSHMKAALGLYHVTPTSLQERIIDAIEQGIDYATIVQVESLQGEDALQSQLYNLLYTLHEHIHDA